MRRVRRSVGRILAAAAVAAGLSVAGLAGAPPAHADGWGRFFVSYCSMDGVNYTNPYYYAVAETYTNEYPACYKTKTRVYYPYLQVAESWLGYPASLAYSAYQTYPVGAEHKLCVHEGCSGWYWIGG